mgnify:CR=1 FL=1
MLREYKQLRGITHMELYASIDQMITDTGSTGFELHIKVQLTAEEAQLIKKYHAERWTLLSPESGKGPAITIGSLIDGLIFYSKDAGEVIAYEQSVKDAFDDLEHVITLMRQFGNEDIYENVM